MASGDTKDRILEAVFETGRTEGIVGTSARSIARTGGFNQALLFYHFGSVREALLAALQRQSAERLARYEARLAGVTTLPELAAVAADLHAEDTETGTITVLSQLLAGAAGDPGLGPELLDQFRPWMALVEDALRRVAAGTGLDEALPYRDLAFAVTSLFVGIELLASLDRDAQQDASLFGSIGALAALVDAVLRAQGRD